MRIGVDARELSGHVTGVGRYLQRLLREWGLAGGSHRWILYSPDGRCGVPPGLDAEVAVVRGAGGTRWEQGALAAAVRRDRPDVFFAPGYSAPLAVRCPVVLTIHDVSFAAHPEWFSWREGHRRRLLARLSARRARAVLTVSAFSRDEIVRHLGVDSARVQVVRHGPGFIDRPVRDTGRRDPLVLFVGSIFNRRHVPALIEGFAALAATRSDARLEIVGANRTHPRQDLGRLAAATGAAARIRLRDWVDDEALARLYADAAVFAFLSEYEGFGLTPIEALAAGATPVVLESPVAREVLDGAALYVARPEPAAVAAALSDAIDGPGRARARAAAPGVLARYDWSAAAAATLAALEDAARR
jgi:glycosyltransferase involved in cell wall biosynthesis